MDDNEYIKAKNGEVEMEYGFEVLPPDYQEWLDSQQPSIEDLDKMAEELEQVF